MIVFKKVNTTDLHQSMYCYLLFTKVIVEVDQNKKIHNQLQSDFKYPSDFGFQKKCWIPSDLNSESVTSLVTGYSKQPATKTLRTPSYVSVFNIVITTSSLPVFLTHLKLYLFMHTFHWLLITQSFDHFRHFLAM